MKVTKFGKQLVDEYKKDRIGDLAASLAYYATFSIVPMLLLAIAIGGVFFGEGATQGEIMAQLKAMLGASGAEFIETALANSDQLSPSANIIASLVGIGLVLAGATRFFVNFQDSLNRVWNVEARKDAGFKEVVKKRAASFGILLGLGVLMLVSTILSAAVSGFVGLVNDAIPGTLYLAEAANYAITLGLATVLFGVIFRYFPDAKVEWRDVWLGAFVTATLMLVGKLLLSLYIGSGSFTTTYGAAASIIIFLVWVYYSMQIVLLGAEFTQVWAQEHGRTIIPEHHARPV